LYIVWRKWEWISYYGINGRSGLKNEVGKKRNLTESNSERLRNNMNEEIETKLDELRKEFETSIKQLEIKQLVVNR